MKFFVVTLALFIAAASADVSHLHLNNEYLPPVRSGGASLSASNSYSVEPQQLQNIEYSQPQRSIEYPQQQTIEYAQAEIQPTHVEHQIPFAIGADTITPAHLAVEQPAAEAEFVADVPVQEEVPAYAQQEAQQEVLSGGIDTQYAPNGGYIY